MASASLRLFMCAACLQASTDIGNLLLPEQQTQQPWRLQRQVNKQLEPRQCGKLGVTKNRIYRGLDAERGDYPWMALLSIPSRAKGGYDIDVRCSSAIISRWFILTAAHCLQNYPVIGPIKITVGIVTVGDPQGTTYTVHVNNTVTHQDYRRENLSCDIALIRLNERIIFTNYIRPICLSSSTRNFAGSNAFIAGWGKIGPKTAKTLQAGKLAVMSNTRCRQKIRYLTDDMICAQVDPTTPHACQGDSGGPLMGFSRDRYFVVGVLSHGEVSDKCRNVTMPNVYMRVSHFLNWIHKHTRQRYDRQNRPGIRV